MDINEIVEVIDIKGRQIIGDVANQIKIELEEYYLGSNTDSVYNTNKTKIAYLNQAFQLSCMRTYLIFLHTGLPYLIVNQLSISFILQSDLARNNFHDFYRTSILVPVASKFFEKSDPTRTSNIKTFILLILVSIDLFVDIRGGNSVAIDLRTKQVCFKNTK